ncbi:MULTISPECIES: capsid protein [unclassified Mesorhizobium]|nr:MULTISPECIES: capsid protein [unclassified Mesorhizobium]MBZ9948241.1 capsid protein [Mesorhizobium sp. BR1-1-11]TPM23738.1 capsid protein [Mesorhizobium sp. B2-3-6]TPM31168.1 capsid protein [Mesorhizobium sp. B2-2-2]TPM43957.1 capsid protein [Mesorhizobium sp. B2-2-3]TPN63449.1 capsid protein [Mesorhizobium sp. B1-1-1]
MAPVVTLAGLFGVRAFGGAVTPSLRTLRAELLRLCARIGYSPPAIL